MDPVLAIASWALLFLGSHLLMSSRALRPRLIAAWRSAYPGVYSLVALATFIPLVLAFAHNKHSGAMLWDLRDVTPVVRWLVWAADVARVHRFRGELHHTESRCDGRIRR